MLSSPSRWPFVTAAPANEGRYCCKQQLPTCYLRGEVHTPALAACTSQPTSPAFPPTLCRGAVGRGTASSTRSCSSAMVPTYPQPLCQPADPAAMSRLLKSSQLSPSLENNLQLTASLLSLCGYTCGTGHGYTVPETPPCRRPAPDLSPFLPSVFYPQLTSSEISFTRICDRFGF